MINKLKRNYFASIFSLTAVFSCFTSYATIVEFQTSQGNIQVNLFDEDTPKTVENFLAYVEDGAYTDSIIHRSVSNFIFQGGGYTFNGAELETIPGKTPVINEPVFSNVKGTIAMAKLGGNPNSATTEWFFNVNNNSANLDVQNGGFTAFGQVIAGDIAVMEAIAGIQKCNAGGAFSEIPLTDFDCNGNITAGAENFITVYQIVIVDSSSATAQNLTPVKNTLINQPEPTTPSDDSSGGSMFWGLIALLSTLVFRTKLTRSH
ncbi:peptidylprolyl isomerase [Pseudocolwellia agarivorans]|uniref:peptidylprolyl isomerase n=1 Tax=Pseudocolwellia agarivorans TaxID=1911682 RepID=UPI000985F288|nr:peptidylprolyl isomerase [Pseudocolwellia agarivorans]